MFYEHYTFQCVVLLLFLTVLLTYLISPVVNLPHIPLMQVGEISPHDVKAAKDFQMEDAAATLKRQQEAETKVLAVYDFDERGDYVDQKLDYIFELLKEEPTVVIPWQERLKLATEATEAKEVKKVKGFHIWYVDGSYVRKNIDTEFLLDSICRAAAF